MEDEFVEYEDPYEDREYPKWVYHKTEKPFIVQNAEEHDALPEGWYTDPDIASGAHTAPPPLATAMDGDDLSNGMAEEAPAKPKGKKREG